MVQGAPSNPTWPVGKRCAYKSRARNAFTRQSQKLNEPYMHFCRRPVDSPKVHGMDTLSRNQYQIIQVVEAAKAADLRASIPRAKWTGLLQS